MPDEDTKPKEGVHLIEIGKINIPNDGADVFGLGKAAKAIPPEVFQQGTASVVSTFERLIAPLTESTAGLGRYIKQKFDGMIEVEKALAAYTLEHAVRRARDRVGDSTPLQPRHLKSFVRSIEEASKETDPALHEMWTNLLASQLTDPTPRPYFVNLLSQYGPSEAKLLEYLLPKHEALPTAGLVSSRDAYTFAKAWVRKQGEGPHTWTPSCTLLLTSGVAQDIVVLRDDRLDAFGNGLLHRPTVFCRTDLGDMFLAAVSPAPTART